MTLTEARVKLTTKRRKMDEKRALGKPFMQTPLGGRGYCRSNLKVTDNRMFRGSDLQYHKLKNQTDLPMRTSLTQYFRNYFFGTLDIAHLASSGAV